MPLHRCIQIIFFAGLLAASMALAQTPYDEGQKALRQAEWQEAAEYFAQAFDSEQADAAMYWRAHALYKAQQKGEAMRQIRDLERQYPDSPWVNEARALRIEHQESGSGTGVDDELRLYALHRLMERDPERAMPLVMDLMQETESPRVRQDALFVLGVSGSPEALQVIADVARNTDDPRFQAEAINILGVAGSDESVELLGSLYTADADRKVRQAVIHAHIVSEKPEPLVAFLREESDPRLQRDIIHALGAMEATDTLHEIYPTLNGKEARVAVIEAYSIAGDSAQLRQVLATESDSKLRRAAIEGIAIAGDDEAAEYLKAIYDEATSRQEKAMVLEALIILDDAREVALKIVRDETDPGLRRSAIEVLGIMGATEELSGLYASIPEKNLRNTVLEAMMIAGDHDGLIAILESETDPGLRSQAIEMLAVHGDKRVRPFMVEMYPTASRSEKQTIIESLMISDDVEGLITLLRQEQDPQLKRQMLEMLTVMDSEEADEYLFELLEKEG